MKINSGFENRIRRQETLSMLYSAQIFRMEWESTTDDGTGVAITPAAENSAITGYNKYYRTTAKTSSEDTWYQFTSAVQGRIHIIDEYDIKNINDDRIVIGDAVILLSAGLNLRAKDKLRFVQLLNNNTATGDASYSGQTLTDSSKSWTTNQWVGYDIVMSDRRYKILSNTATTVTIDPIGQTVLNDTFDTIETPFDEYSYTFDETVTISYTIQPTVTWYPKLLSPRLGAFVTIGNQAPLQTILCSREEQTGAIL